MNTSQQLGKEAKQQEGQPLALRPREAAKALGVSLRTLQEWTASGLLPHARLGRIVIYPVHLLVESLSKMAAQSAADESSEETTSIAP